MFHRNFKNSRRLPDLKIDPEEAGFAVVGKSWSRERFLYPYDRLYFVTEGEGSVTTRSGEKIALLPGCCYLLPAFKLRRADCRKRMAHHYIHFYVGHDDNISIHDLYEGEWVCRPSHPVETEKLFRLAAASARGQSISDRLEIEGAIRLLLAPFFAGSKERARSGRLSEVLATIEAHLGEEISISDLASSLGYHPNYFSSLFQKTFGIPPKRYILEKRLERAQRLLWRTELSVREVASEVGFTDEVHFAKLFRKYAGTNPLAFRKSRG